MDSNVLAPIITAWVVVVCLKKFISSLFEKMRLLLRPRPLFSVMQAIAVMSMMFPIGVREELLRGRHEEVRRQDLEFERR
jgi:predicted ferric reductase